MRSRGAGGGRQPMSSGADGSEAGPGPLPAPEPEKGRDPPSKQGPQQEVAAAEALAPLPAVTIVISRPEEEVQVTEPKGVTPHSPKTANVKAREASVSVTAAAVTIVISRPGEEVQVIEPKGVTPQSPKTAEIKAREASVSVAVAAAAKEAELARTDSFDDYEQCRVCQEKTEEPLVDLGCQCRGDLAKAHRTCIDVWFHTRGSNKCEICQQVAVNIPPPETQASTSYWVWRVDSTYGRGRGVRPSRSRDPGAMASPDLFPNVSFSDVSAGAALAADGATAALGVDATSGGPRLSLVRAGKPEVEPTMEIDLSDAQIFKLGPKEWLCVNDASEAKAGVDKKSFSRAIKVVLRTEAESKAFSLAFQRWKQRVISGKPGELLENGSIIASRSKFDTKIEASSAKMYFHYYGQLLHQQNMLQDFVRTGTYYAAVMENRSDFEGRVVVDVGAGSGILSLFAAQAGARHVYAVEASEIAEHAQRLISGNPSLGQRITVIKGKVEEVELPEKADILISEPMGTLLINERMLESYVIARDRFLAPNGKMFPTTGRIHMAPFSDEYLYVEMANKALFWQQHNFFGVDLTPLHGSAFQGYFSQPVVDAFDPRLLICPPTYHTLDFTSMKEEELYEIDIPLSFIATVGTRVHGLACWFDVLFNGSTVQRWLTTAPGSPTTHWYQIRCVLSQPLYVMAGQEITGRLHLVAHSAQSYTIYLTMSAKMWGVGVEQGGILQTSTGKLELKEPYYRLSQPQSYMVSQDQQQQPSFQQQGSEQQMQEGLSPGITIDQVDQDCGLH